MSHRPHPLVRFLDGVLREFVVLLDSYRPPARPGPLRAHLLREEGTMLIYGITVEPPSDPDEVVGRKLTVEVNGTTRETLAVAQDATELEIAFEAEDVVVLTLTDVDEAGNEASSEPLSFTAADTLPPDAPGPLSARLIREE
jgi:hypothetical protein